LICQNSEPKIGPLIDSKTEETERCGELKEPWYDGCVKLFTRFLFTMLACLGLLGIACSQDAEKVFAKASKSVFTIETPNSYGTGFMVAPDIMVTCYHVVKGAGANISLREASGVTADYVIHNEVADIAVFRLSRRLENYLRFAEAVNVGSSIYVIGTPLGALERSITSGIVSQKYKIAGIPQLQITAPISPGSSGSPVLNKDGKVVGMAQATLREGQANNFALDYSVIKSLVPTNEASKKTESKKNEVIKPIKKYIVGTEKSIRYLRPTKLYKMPDTSSEEVWECRGLTYGQAYKTKYPNWVAVSMTDGSVSYCKTENVEFVDAKAQKQKSDPFYVEEPDFFEQCVKEINKAENTNYKTKDSYKKLLSMGANAIQLLINKMEYSDPNYETLWKIKNEITELPSDLFGNYFLIATNNQKYVLIKLLHNELTNKIKNKNSFNQLKLLKSKYNNSLTRTNIENYLKADSIFAKEQAIGIASILEMRECRDFAQKLANSEDILEATTGFWAFCALSSVHQFEECQKEFNNLDLRFKLRDDKYLLANLIIFTNFGYSGQEKYAYGQVVDMLLDFLDEDNLNFQAFALKTLKNLSQTNRLSEQSECEKVFTRSIPLRSYTLTKNSVTDEQIVDNWRNAYVLQGSLIRKVDEIYANGWKQLCFQSSLDESSPVAKLLKDKNLRSDAKGRIVLEMLIECSGFVKEVKNTEFLSKILVEAPEFYEECLIALDQQHTMDAKIVVQDQIFSPEASIRRLARQILEKW
jgi:hypothetical protein